MPMKRTVPRVDVFPPVGPKPIATLTCSKPVSPSYFNATSIRCYEQDLTRTYCRRDLDRNIATRCKGRTCGRRED